MPDSYLFFGIYSFILGTLGIFFRDWLGKNTTKFSEKVLGIKYDKGVYVGNKRGFLIFGSIFTIVGLYLILTNLR